MWVVQTYLENEKYWLWVINWDLQSSVIQIIYFVKEFPNFENLKKLGLEWGLYARWQYLFYWLIDWNMLELEIWYESNH